jgi:FO synthase
MHAVPRLVLHPLIENIQTSWVKMGAQGAAICLNAGANDLGGTLMNESITRAAGGVHGQELDAAKLQALARRIGRTARQRTTLYGAPDEEHVNGERLRSREAPSSSDLATVG